MSLSYSAMWQVKKDIQYNSRNLSTYPSSFCCLEFHAERLLLVDQVIYPLHYSTLPAQIIEKHHLTVDPTEHVTAIHTPSSP